MRACALCLIAFSFPPSHLTPPLSFPSIYIYATSLQDDDYYDDDDYYEEEEDEQYSYQQQQEQQRKEREERERAAAAAALEAKAQEAANARARAAAASSRSAGGGAGGGGISVGIGVGSTGPQVPSASERTEKERLVEGMGFTTKQARTALEATSYDVQRAIEHLVGSSSAAMGVPSAPSPPAAAQQTPREDERKRLIASFDASRPAPPPPPVSRPTGTGTGAGGGKKAGGAVSIGSARASPVPPPSSAPPQASTPNPENDSAAPSAAAPTVIVGPTTGKRAKISNDLLSSLQNQRSRLSMVVLGHVDAGKSTLMGQVLLKLGHVQKRTITKYQKQAAELGKASFALAWVMDEDDSERERGVTMDIGTKFAKTPTHDLTILDAPGHADFVPAMITGAASADVGLLVVAATPGEFEAGFEPSDSHHRGGQTREHIILSRGLGVSQLLVAVNKLDAADPSWSQGRFEEIKGKVLPFLQTNGFKPHRVRFVPVSGLTGTNVKDRPTSDDAAALREWYDGPTLLDAIDGFFPANRKIEEPMRIIVSDLFPEGKGITAKGRCIQGICSVGDQVIVLPIGDVATVGRIEHGKAQSASNPYSFAKDETGGDDEKEGAERAKVAVAGDSVDIYLTGIDIARIHPGNVLSHVDLDLRPAVKKKFRASLMVMDDLAVPIIRGAQALLHMHSIDTPAVVSKLICTKNRDGSVKRQKPRVLAGGASASVEITLDQKISISKYADCRALGRFVLRRGGDTIAVGIIDEILG